MLKIFEIYESIQGESSFTGLPCTFIRLTGCPLRCSWCDSEYSFEGGEYMSIESILLKVKTKTNNLVLVTGGEPLAQKNVYKLFQALIKNDYTTMVETSGAFDIANLPKETIAIIDVKCPESKMNKKMHWQNLSKLRSHDEIKFVIANKNDFLWACVIVKKYNLKSNRIIISPVWEICKLLDLAKWLLESGENFYLQTQMHKFIWGADITGV